MSSTADIPEREQHRRPTAGELAVGVIIGRTSEFFDFFVYAIASVLVFPQLVFPFADPLRGMFLSFAVFTLAFLARPFGTLLFMALDRAYGREAKLIGALFLLGTATVALGFLPSFEGAGPVSIIVLVVLRVAQGLAWGGTWDGLPSLLAVNAPEKKRGWYAMLPQLGAPFGLIVASGLFIYFISNLSSADFLDWGWRYPFFVAFALNVVALFARLRMVVSDEFAALYEHRALQPTLVKNTIREEGRNVLLGAFAPLASFALFHMVTVFPLSWLFLFSNETPVRFLVIELLSAFVGVVAILLSGALADRIGRRSLLIGSAIAIAAFSGFAPSLLSGGSVGETLFMTIGFVLLGLSFGQASGAVASNFSPRNRYTGSAITADFAWLFGAGLAPLAALALSATFGLQAAGGYLLSGAACTLAALSIAPSLGRKGDDN